MKYRTKPVEVEAIQWTGNNQQEINDFLGHSFDYYHYNVSGENRVIYFYTNSYTYITVTRGNWIIKDKFGILSSCASEVFEQQYEKAE